MKKVITSILCKGYSRTKKHSVEEMSGKLYIMRFLLENDPVLGIRHNDNPFWKPENNKNRSDLIGDVSSIHRFDVMDNAYFHIINRMANGDAYGIELPY